MIIKREYSLPNCTLILSGMSDDSSSAEESKNQVINSILSAECNFVGLEKSISGEKDFFENLIASVSSYAQECLSGLRYPPAKPTKDNSNPISIARVADKNLHRLVWQPPEKEKVEIELTTIQLFDLVEAIDQFFDDRLTLPDRQLELKPLSRRHRTSDEPLAKRSAPAAFGLAGLAVSALVMFVTPIPERDPQPSPTPQPTNNPARDSTQQ